MNVDTKTSKLKGKAVIISDKKGLSKGHSYGEHHSVVS